MFYIKNPTARWPHNDVPYVIGDYPSPQILREAMNYINQATGNLVTFSDVTSNTGNIPSYLVFVKSQQNFAEVGMRPGKNRVELIPNFPQPRRTAIHEISHALGIAHEHQSPNRDQFIKVNFDNVRDDLKNKFDVLTSGFMFEPPYDFESISHYDAFAGNKGPNLRTIEIKNPQDFHFSDVMGKKETFSDSDIKALKKMYST